MAVPATGHSKHKYSAELAESMLIETLKRDDIEEKVKLTNIPVYCSCIQFTNPKQCYKLLQTAVSHNNSTAVFIRLLESGVTLNPKDSPSLLHYAAFYGKVEIITELVKKGFDVNSKDTKGCVPMHWAIRANQTEAVKNLLEHEANISVLDNNNKDLFFLTRSPEILKLLNEKSNKIPPPITSAVTTKPSNAIKKSFSRQIRKSTEIFSLREVKLSEDEKPKPSEKAEETLPIEKLSLTDPSSKEQNIPQPQKSKEKEQPFEYPSHANWY